MSGEKCPSCGGDSIEMREEIDERTAMYCASCGYRLYPPEDRHEHLIRAQRSKRPKKNDIRIAFDSDESEDSGDTSPRSG